MQNSHLVLYIFAVVFFLLAAFPNITAPRPIRFEWLAFAALASTLIV